MKRKSKLFIPLLIIITITIFFLIGTYKSKEDVINFLSYNHLEKIDFTKDWLTFANKLDLSQNTVIEKFEIKYSRNKQVLYLQIRFYDKDSDYLYTFSNEYIYSDNNDVITKPIIHKYIKEDYIRAELIDANSFFDKLNIIKSNFENDSNRAYNVFYFKGYKSNLGMDAEYYKITESNDLKRLDTPPYYGYYIMHSQSRELDGEFGENLKIIMLD